MVSRFKSIHFLERSPRYCRGESFPSLSLFNFLQLTLQLNMPRRQPRRSSHASTGSYTSFFGRSSRGSNSSSSSALSSSSSQSPSPPASPAVLTPAPVQVTPPAPSTRSSPNDSTASSSKKKQPNPQAIAEIEETLEALFQGAPGPVHSLKSVELKQKKQLDIDMREAGMERTLRAWWIKR